MSKRVAGSLPHQPARRTALGVGAVALVDEQRGDRAGPGVEVLVGAPHGEVDVPLVESQLDVAGRVGEIEPDDATGIGGRRATMPWRSSSLTGEVVDAAQPHERDLVAPRRPARARQLVDAVETGAVGLDFDEMLDADRARASAAGP